MPIPESPEKTKEPEKPHEFIKDQDAIFKLSNQALRDAIEGKPTAKEYIEQRNKIAP